MNEEMIKCLLSCILEKSSKTEKQQDEHPWVKGQAYLIRTVTMTLTGRLRFVGEKELELEDACWIADSGRFSKAILGEWDSNSEHEPFKENLIVGRGSIIDATKLSCTLPKTVK